MSAEAKTKVSLAMKGKPKSASHRASISKVQKVVQKVAQARPEVRAKKSEAAKKAWTPERRAVQANINSSTWANRSKEGFERHARSCAEASKISSNRPDVRLRKSIKQIGSKRKATILVRLDAEIARLSKP